MLELVPKPRACKPPEPHATVQQQGLMPAQTPRLQAGRKGVCPSSQIPMETSTPKEHTASACHTAPKGSAPWAASAKEFLHVTHLVFPMNLCATYPQTCPGTWQLTPLTHLDLTNPINAPTGLHHRATAVPGTGGFTAPKSGKYSRGAVPVSLVAMGEHSHPFSVQVQPSFQWSNLSWFNPSQQIPTQPTTHFPHWAGKRLGKVKERKLMGWIKNNLITHTIMIIIIITIIIAIIIIIAMKRKIAQNLKKFQEKQLLTMN